MFMHTEVGESLSQERRDQQLGLMLSQQLRLSLICSLYPSGQKSRDDQTSLQTSHPVPFIFFFSIEPPKYLA